MLVWAGYAIAFGIFFYRAADFEKFDHPLRWALASELCMAVSYSFQHGLLGIVLLQLGLFVVMGVVRQRNQRRGIKVPRDG